MAYKSYPTVISTPQRMARKRLRRDIFVANKKAAKARRKAKRSEHKMTAAKEESVQ